MTINVAYTPLGEGGMWDYANPFHGSRSSFFFFFVDKRIFRVYESDIYRVRLGWIDGGGIYCFEIIENEFS